MLEGMCSCRDGSRSKFLGRWGGAKQAVMGKHSSRTRYMKWLSWWNCNFTLVLACFYHKKLLKPPLILILHLKIKFVHPLPSLKQSKLRIPLFFWRKDNSVDYRHDLGLWWTMLRFYQIQNQSSSGLRTKIFKNENFSSYLWAHFLGEKLGTLKK